MQPIKSINIPTPCHESWPQMAAAENGRHCRSCCKTVIDFTAMPNADVIAYLASHKNTCGRITGSKLAAINHQLEIKSRKRFTWKGFIAAASLSMLFPAVNAKAQVPPKTEQAPVAPELMGKTAQLDTTSYITIKGVVIAKDDGLPVPGASVRIKDSNIGTQTTVNGSFTLRAPTSATWVTVSTIGYTAIDLPVVNLDKKREIIINPVFENSVSVALGIVVYTTIKQPFYKRWWFEIKNIF
ncbi:carboxypeptidase-like regulatory domain-containing protein [Mucilaginibacter sp.]|uniref:carboxypeptidase-like regulatory domain-containing protein n=1 Tax=Mucilaginibacter sp. TaxID=1882438 RepID=UPI003262D54F